MDLVHTASLAEAETLAGVMVLISGLCCVAWGALGTQFSMSAGSRFATYNFSLANVLLVIGGLLSHFRRSDVSFLAYFQSMNLSDLLFLWAIICFRSGMRALYGLSCTTLKQYARVAMAAAAVVVVTHRAGVPNAVAAGCYMAAGWFSLQGFRECNAVLRPLYSARARWVFLWPVVLAGVLFILRALDDSLSMVRHQGALTESMRALHFVAYLWAELMVLLLLNASLIGQTLKLLITRLNNETARLQTILDTAPVGVAVITEGVIRFANPRVTELLDIRVGDPMTKALVHSSDEERVQQQLGAQGRVADVELQMYCPNHTVRDLVVTYLPTQFDGKSGVLSWIIDITERKRDEKKVIFNRTVVENAEPMFWADPTTLDLVYGNRAGLELMELSAVELAGRKIPEQFLVSMTSDERAHLREQMRSMDRPHRFAVRHERRNGEVLYLDVSAYIAEDEERSLLVASMRDITAQHQAELAMRQAIDEQTAMFEAATLGIAFIKDWTIVRGNHRMEQIFGWQFHEMQGQSPRMWWCEDSSALEDLNQDIRAGGIHNSTQQLQRKDGSRFWCRLSGSAIDPQDISRGTVWMFDDVTAEREAAELMRHAKELAEEATRMKSDFLANMSHEIRTPMNAIVGMSRLALLTDLNPKQRNYIEKVDSAARSLLGIINDILDFSKIEAGKLRFEKADFHIEDVLENVADLCVIKAQDKGLELLFDVAPDVPTALVGDSLRLGQVLLNLVGNAIKFTEHGEVTLSIRTLPTPADTADGPVIGLRFEVSDTGVGLSPDQQDKLFSAFAQADASTTRKYGGTGLGLTISKRLVELMGGSIGVRSRLGEGSTFYFSAQFALQADQREQHVLEPDVMQLRVLVVDDNARAREIMLAILQSQKFDAAAVHSGHVAMQALAEAKSEGRPYGLVLMDWMMPEMDGLSTIRKIRAHPELEGTPAFVMVTAHSRDELLEHACDTRIDGVLLKPVGPSAVLDSILTALGKEVVTHGRKRQREEANLEAESKLRGACLLLVEDNAVNQELALEILQGAGLHVDVANNGAEAVGMVHRKDYDGVLMDCQMPVMDGFEATRQIRADSRFATLPILAMTANAMSGDRELCLQSGMNDHIGKPIEVKQLFTTLARWVTPRHPEGNAPSPDGQTLRDDTLPAIVGLDLALALRRLGGNRALLRRLIARFAETQRTALERIKTALAHDDSATATLEAHTVKGLAGNIGAGRLLERAQALERSLKQGLDAELDTALATFGSELSALLEAIDLALPVTPSLSGTSAPDAGPVNRSMLQEQMQKMAALLADDDSEAGKLLDAVAQGLQSLDQAAAASQMRKLMARYDFEGALEVLGDAASALLIDLSLTRAS